MLKLGLALDWGKPRIDINIPLLQRAEQLGFDAVWAAEAYGSDALTPLAYIAGHTQHLRLGTAVAQVAARAPAALAMAVATLDQLAGGDRVICGLGLSGPQVVEGWYGQAWGKPTSKMRDYVSILRQVWQREKPVSYGGETYQLPYQGEDASGLGKALKSILHTNPNIPVLLGTGSKAMVELTAEIADGWLPFGFVPGMLPQYQNWLDNGFARGNRRPENFQIQAGAQLLLTDDVKAGIDSLKPMIAMYVGGMGAKQKNFHKDLMVRRGFADAAEAIQQAFLAGDMPAAIAAVPDDYVDDGALIGSEARLRERYRAWQDSGATGLILHMVNAQSLEVIARIADLPPRT